MRAPASLMLVLLLFAGCDRIGQETLVVYAASSLTDVFGELESTFEQENPGVDVRLNFSGSQVLRLQIERGAEADLFASAHPEHLDSLQRDAFVTQTVDFATTGLVVLVPEESDRVASFADLPAAEKLVLGSPNVPVGEYSREALRRAAEELPAFAGIEHRVVSEELNARLVRAKVELGEADAAIVYRSDAIGAHGVRALEVPSKFTPQIRYRIGVIGSASTPAQRWLELLRSAAGLAALERHGFEVEQ